MFYINDIFVLGGVSTVLFANYPGEVATAVEKLMRYLDHNVTGYSGMPLMKYQKFLNEIFLQNPNGKLLTYGVECLYLVYPNTIK